MAEENKDLEKDQNPEVLEDSLSKTEVILEENKDLISRVLIGVAIVIAVIFGYNNFFAAPAEEAALEDIWPAQRLFEQDSVELSIAEFSALAEDHGGTKAGNLANLYLGLSQLKAGDFEDALASFESFDAEGKLTPGLKLGLIGDCYSELGNTTEAVAYYKKAAKTLDSKAVSPYFLKKAGVLLEQNSNFEEASTVYELALSQYLSDDNPSVQSVKNDIEMYLARANAAK